MMFARVLPDSGILTVSH